MNDISKHPLPPAAAEYLRNNFRDGFLFEDFKEVKNENGDLVFITLINDGNMLHRLTFTEHGAVRNREIVPIYPDEPRGQQSDGEGEFYEDDY